MLPNAPESFRDRWHSCFPVGLFMKRILRSQRIAVKRVRLGQHERLLRRRAPFAAKRRGFTLIEFVLALILVGIVSALAIPRMTQAFNQANANGAKTLVAEMVNKARFSA